MEVAIAILAPTLGFGLFALLAMRYGAESRPGFDERPVKDDRPNWFPIPRSAPGPATLPPAPRDDGHRVPAASPPRAAAPARRRAAPLDPAVRRPATGSAG